MARYRAADKARVLRDIASRGDAGARLADMTPDDESITIRLMHAGLITIEGTPGVQVNGARAVITDAGRAWLGARDTAETPDDDLGR